MSTVTLPPECPPCDSSGYLVDWHDGLISCGYSTMRTAWFYSRRCPFCATRERHRLAWLLASMRMPGSARRI
jgi:hypothetical protein